MEEQSHYIRETLRLNEYVESDGMMMPFEASTHYGMNGDVLAKDLMEALPWVKIVVSLREPISRAASMLVHMYDTARVGCLAKKDTTLYSCLKNESQLVPRTGPFNHMDSLNGNYSLALWSWMRFVPREQLHVLQYEMIVNEKDSPNALHRLKEFLGLDQSLEKKKSSLGAHNMRHNRIKPNGWPMKKKEYEELIAMVKPDVKRWVLYDFIVLNILKIKALDILTG